ncbi:adenosylmethionine--8-amino-7-oxononanoate transaminase [Psychrobacter sp. F1192]|uniref:Adenosylmethionine-8-amino-7-oxononanoate aminotransferase n=1 Tax=Psychrobacter coccoides TaxID=2818440 RepID=A0ABS3NQK9_9GAMM|nr:adenosylmethionine--8-amino-7-oxononanoate transaminase [Psychrobacter coccoides]MBO1531699.1 adenosylmethionine--8-amino-7-oxononanoate transaminase [Psychrobacter coccoides]
MTTYQTSLSAKSFDEHHLWHPYTSLPPTYPNLVIERAEGVYLYTQSGEALIDGMSSWWAAVHGYNHPTLNKAVSSQLNKMAHVMFGGLTHPPAIELGKTLLSIVPNGLDAIFYADSGSIAVEVALKMALQYQLGGTHTNRKQIATTRSGYYGDTWHAMSICDPKNGMHSIYGQQLPVQLFTDAPSDGFDKPLSDSDKEKLIHFFDTHYSQMAAFIIEPIVQGAGGMRFYSQEYLRLLRDLCDKYEVLLIADEIATGFGRTGSMFACQHADITPDIMTVGKALTGGYMTFAATLCQRHVAEVIANSDYPALMHGPTFMGNPLACAVANASLQLLIEGDYPARARHIQTLLRAHLSKLITHSAIKDVRTLGAIGVVELYDPVDMTCFQQLLVKHKVWIRPFGKLVYIMPPIIMTDDEVTMLCERLMTVLTEYFESI